mmetsp:Transcript_10452/g.22657  ORF Transcript_10452/g.22657 Transcript_10452/m.22657 type:complete len:115 (+) Transcript_10452:157-501(+)
MRSDIKYPFVETTACRDNETRRSQQDISRNGHVSCYNSVSGNASDQSQVQKQQKERRPWDHKIERENRNKIWYSRQLLKEDTCREEVHAYSEGAPHSAPSSPHSPGSTLTKENP